MTAPFVRFELIGADAVAFEHDGARHVVRRVRGAPLHAAFRAALGAGVDPTAAVEVVRGGRAALIVNGPLAAHAAHDLREDDRGFRRVAWRPYGGGAA
jgi:hypothetical protein